MAKANPILRQVEQLLDEAEELDRQAIEHLSQIRQNDNEVQILIAHAMLNARFRGELMQSMAELQTKLTELRRQLQEKRRESEEKKARVNELRNEEDRCGYHSREREEEADIADRQSDDVEREANRIAQELEWYQENQAFGGPGGSGGSGGASGSQGS